MAEVGLVASIVGIAGACAKLALGFYDIASSLGSAAKEAKSVASEISVISNVLTTLSWFTTVLSQSFRKCMSSEFANISL